jgi:hypothetical protein
MTTFRRYSGRFLESKGSFTFAKRPAIATWMYLPWLIELYMFQLILRAIQSSSQKKELTSNPIFILPSLTLY